MRELQDQQNKNIVRNYVEMPDRQFFSARDIAAATGVNLQTVRNVLAKLEKQNIVVKLANQRRGKYYRQATDTEKLVAEAQRMSIAELAAERGVSRQRLHQIAKASGLKLKGQRITDNQLYCLTLLSTVKWTWGYDIRDYESMKQLTKLGLVIREKVGRFNRYLLNEKGQEVLNAQS